MSRFASFPPIFRLVVRIMLSLAALDSVAIGLWAFLRPGDVFSWLRLPVVSWERPQDRLQLGAGLGLLGLAYALYLVILIWRPDRHGPLAIVPFFGRLIGVGMWLFVLASDRVEIASGPALLLAAHDGFWALVLAGFLTWWWRTARREDDQ